MKPFWMYMLECADGAYDVGHTDDLDARLAQHEVGELPGYTRQRRPVRLVYTCEFATREEALALERRVKGWTRAKKQALIEGNWDRIHLLARGRAVRPSTAPPLRGGSAQDERGGDPRRTDPTGSQVES